MKIKRFISLLLAIVLFDLCAYAVVPVSAAVNRQAKAATQYIIPMNPTKVLARKFFCRWGVTMEKVDPALPKNKGYIQWLKQQAEIYPPAWDPEKYDGKPTTKKLNKTDKEITYPWNDKQEIVIVDYIEYYNMNGKVIPASQSKKDYYSLRRQKLYVRDKATKKMKLIETTPLHSPAEPNITITMGKILSPTRFLYVIDYYTLFPMGTHMFCYDSATGKSTEIAGCERFVMDKSGKRMITTEGKNQYECHLIDFDKLAAGDKNAKQKILNTSAWNVLYVTKDNRFAYVNEGENQWVTEIATGKKVAKYKLAGCQGYRAGVIDDLTFFVGIEPNDDKAPYYVIQYKR